MAQKGLSLLCHFVIFAFAFAIVAQLVERWLPKPKVAGSCPVYRSQYIRSLTRVVMKRRTKRSLAASALFCSLFVINPVSAQLSKNPDKFLGNITTWGQMDYGAEAYYTLWNQVTPENESKWGSVEGTKGSYNFSGANNIFNYAKNHNFTYKLHALVWGAQYPNWFNSEMPVEDRYNAIVKWFDAVKRQFKTLPMIDVVNEAVGMHQQGNPLMKESLGGGGITGYDWLINAFELAYERWPDAILIYNDYNTFQFDTDAYIDLVRTLRDAGAPIDAYGCQSHELKGFSKSSLINVDTKIQNALKMPMYVTEYDIQTEDDDAQLTDYKAQIPYFWENDYCAGITLWGYIYGKTWNEGTSGIIKYNDNTRKNTDRKAMTWLREYMDSDKAKNAKSPFPGMKKQISLYIKPATISATKNEALPITVRARMVDQNVKIDSIKLYAKGKLVKKMTQTPYVAEYVPTTTGRHDLKAIVYTNDGKTYEREGGFTAYNPRSPFKTINIPGTLQAEDFDKGGEGLTYHDDSKIEGDASSYRSDNTGVDIVAGNNGRAIGYTNSGEWLEYTVNVAETATYSYEAYVSSGTDNSSFKLSLLSDGGLIDLTDVITVPKTGSDWNTYKTIGGQLNTKLKEGKNIIRISITSSSCNIDKIVFSKVEFNNDIQISMSTKPRAPITVGSSTNITVSVQTDTTTIADVKIYKDGELVKTATRAPYSYYFRPTERGIYNFKAVATDTNGGQSDIATYALKATSPYKSSALILPGIIQAENFDVGKEGFSFHDSDDTDEGKANYRTDNGGVDIVTGNGGYALGHTAKGEWYEYTVRVREAGPFDVIATVSSGNSTSSFIISEVIEETVQDLCKIDVPQTANNDWSKYETVPKAQESPIHLGYFETGIHVLRITIDGAYCNIDKIEVINDTSDVKYITDDDKKANGTRYNLSGMPVDESYKGFVIMNGKTLLQQ